MRRVLWSHSSPLILSFLLVPSLRYHTVHPYLLALPVRLPASSWYFTSSAAGTGFFWCQLKAQLLKKIKLGPSWLSYVPIRTWIQHSGADHMIILDASLRAENPVFPGLQPHFQPSIPQAVSSHPKSGLLLVNWGLATNVLLDLWKFLTCWFLFFVFL